MSKARFCSAALVLAGIAFALSCGPTAEELAAVDFEPTARDDWPVSTPEAEGLDPVAVAALYLAAEDVETIESLLLFKNGRLVGERYWREGGIDRDARLQSVTKSFTSALVGLAIEHGCLESVDQHMMAFFPELTDRIRDPRKNEITIRHMLEMRAGYPWEESSEELFKMMYGGFRPSLLVDVPLVRDPGSGMEYSNLTSHLLSVVVSRACETDLLDFAQQLLFSRIGVQPGEWITDWEGYRNGHADLFLSAREMARFGQLILDEGVWNGERILPAEWIRDSLAVHSEDAWPFRVGRHWRDVGYGYQWWSVRAGEHRYGLAWGHGGQQIALLDSHDLMVVVTADPQFGEHGGGPWKREKQNLNLVADFIATIPGAN